MQRTARFAAALVVAAAACSFPQHEFVSDGVLAAKGGHSSSGGTAPSAGAGTGGDHLSEGGASGSASEGGASGSAHGGSSDGQGGDPGQGGTPDSTLGLGGAAGAASEICSNQLDDDGDGRIDCADKDDCSEWGCFPSVPEGWVGPVAIGTDTTAATPLACSQSGGYDVTLTAAWCTELSTKRADCGICPSCGAVSNPEATIVLKLASDCVGTCATVNSADCQLKQSAGCTKLTINQGTLSPGVIASQLAIRPESPMLAGGTCEQPANAAVAMGPLESACLGRMQVCRGQTTGSCPVENSRCMLKPKQPFGEVPCIYFEGADVSCPSGWDKSRHLVHTTISDGRACSPCRCDLPAASAYSKPAVDVANWGNDPTCHAGTATTASGEWGCAQLGLNDFGTTGSVQRYLNITFWGITAPPCVVAGGEPLGSVEAAGKVTVCCTST